MEMRSAPSRRIIASQIAAAFASAVILGLAGNARAQVVGFGGAAETGWTPNNNVGANPGTAGLPSVTGTGTAGDVLTLTNANNGQATSYWFNTPQNITNFLETFTYTGGGGGNGADGITAAWQNNSLLALGGGGGSKGFGGITSAAAMSLNIYGGNSGSGSGYTGATANNVGLPTTPTPGGVNITSGDPINVSFSYKQSDGALTETMTDTVTNATFTRVYRGIDIQSQVGAATALIGFTGGTGGLNQTQTVTNFHYTSGAALSTPVATITPIAATGYNQNMISSVASGTANLTATMDGGTAKTGDTFYEVGVNPGANTSGVPKAGVVFGSGNDASHTFVLQPNGPGQNDAVLLNQTSTTGALTLTSPARYSALSFLITGGNGGAPIGVTVNYVGGGTQSATITAPDWFNNSSIAYDANGRADVNLDDFNSVNGGNPRIYQQDLTLTDTTDAVTSVNFTWMGTAGNGDNDAVFGISGQAVPEPSSLALLGFGALGIVVRRRRAARGK